MSVQVMTAPPRAGDSSGTATGAAEGESRVLMREVGWEGYESLLKLVGDRPSPRLAYLNGDVELMSPGYQHESIGERLGLLVPLIVMGLGIPFQPAGLTTFRRRDLDRGIEGDKTYYLANAARVRGNKKIDLEVDPPPDLAIEVEITRPVADRLAIYAGLGVPEVWICDEQSLRFLRLGPDGSYDEVEASVALPPLTRADLIPWIARPPDLDEAQWLLRFQDWVRDTLAPRLGRPGA